MKVGDIVYRCEIIDLGVKVRRIAIKKVDERFFYCTDTDKYSIASFKLWNCADNGLLYPNTSNVYSLSGVKHLILNNFANKIAMLIENLETSDKQEMNIIKGYFKED